MRFSTFAGRIAGRDLFLSFIHDRIHEDLHITTNSDSRAFIVKDLQHQHLLATGTLKAVGPDIWKLKIQYHISDTLRKRRIRKYLRMLMDDYTACLLYAIFTIIGCPVDCQLVGDKWTLAVTIPEHVFAKLVDFISKLHWQGVVSIKSSLEPLISSQYKVRSQLTEPRWNFQPGVKYISLANGRLITQREKSLVNTLLSYWFKSRIRCIRFVHGRKGWGCRINGQTYWSRSWSAVKRWAQCQIFGLVFSETEDAC